MIGNSKQPKSDAAMIEHPKKKSLKNWLSIFILPIWTYGAFISVQMILFALLLGLKQFGVNLGAGDSSVIFTTAMSVLVYVGALALAIVVPIYLWKSKTTMSEIGLTDWMSWWDLLIAPLAFVVYLIGSGLFIALVSSLVTIDLHQPQALPFSQSMLSEQWQYMLAFFTLAVLAPLAEELLFRGYLYGKLRQYAPIWLSVLIASVAFGLAHLWAGPESPLQWAVAVDTFVFSLVLCLAREYTRAIWVSVLMHMIKNSLAFYLLFINVNLVEQLKAGILSLII